MSMGEEGQKGERSISEMMSSVFSIYSSHFAEVVIPFVLVGFASGFLSYSTFTLIPVEEISNYPDPSAIFDNIGRFMLSLFLLMLVSMILSVVAGGMVVKFTSDVIETGKGSVQSSFDETIARFPHLLVASLVTTLLIGIGFILLIAPGVILAVIFSLTIPVVMIERRGAFDSLSRSQRLVEGRWKKIFGLLLMVAVTIALVNLLVLLFSGPSSPLATVLASVIGSVVEPLYFIASTVLYHSMIIREQVGI